MLIALAIFYVIFTFLMLLYVIWYGWELWLAAWGVPPFIRTRQAVAEEAVAVFGPLPAGSVVYDPGCGDARVLRALARANPQASFRGVELRWQPYLMAQWTQRRELLPNLTVRRGDLFTQDFSDATHLYVYLYPWVMDKMLPKLQRELKPGVTLVSLDFEFKDKAEERTVPVRSPGKLGKTFYVYAF